MCLLSCWRTAKEDLAITQPQLLNFKRLGSYRLQNEKKDKAKASPEHVASEVKADGFDGDYEIKIVAGVPQKVPIHSGTPSPSQSPAVVMRKPKRHAARRRISCKDLGRGDCQGWLYKKKEKHGALSGGWGKRWFVLKNKNLYYYKDQNDEKAGGVIYLPAFQISPAQEKSKNKYAFKAHHAGTTFYFASDSIEDRSKWMNKMGLAAISYNTPTGTTVAGFQSPTVSQTPSSMSEHSATYCSDSDDDMSDTHSVEWDSSSEAGSMETLNKLATDITKQGVTIDGRNFRDRRSSHLSRIEEVPMLNKEYIKNSKKLISLQRTLKDKESDLAHLESVLSSNHLSSEMLQNFLENNPSILSGTLPEREQSSSEESLSDDVIESPVKGSTESSSIHSSPRREEESSIGSPQHDKRESLV